MLRFTFPEPYLDAFHALIRAWEKAYGRNHAGFPKFLFDFFIFKSPLKQHDHIPAEYFPVQEKKKSKDRTKYSDRLRKKTPDILLRPYSSTHSLISRNFQLF